KGVAQEKVNYKIRDWLISRQRYWGAPIPIIHCPKDGAVAVPDDQLPVVLPEMKSFEPSGDGRSPLARAPEFVNTTCPTCGGPAERETDTMDGFACSSWYFLRFADPHNADKPFDAEKVKYWLPVDDYIGGAEHAVMHLLYARMWTKVMQDAGLIDFGEPFKTLRNQGMILAPDGAKMSKSKGNTIEPDGLIEQGYGADAIRIMELFIGPWNQAANWSVEGMGGAFRFLQRVWALSQDYMNRGDSQQLTDDIELKRVVHRAIHRVSKDLEEMGFNTAIAALMETVNDLYKLKTTIRYEQAPETWGWAITSLVQLLAPFAPHITEELWHQLGKDGSIHQSEWPVHDEQYLVSDTITVVVQVNGKLRAQLEIAADASQEDIIAQAKADAKVAEHLGGAEPKKSIYVPGKLVNFVV
ncbi:MAG TPA: class I tRNA ligase family protein, partial [Candidatus Saccharimonadales bacterium]